MKPQYYIGVMSGTSLDGVDLALMDFASPPGQLIASDFMPMSADLRSDLTALFAGTTSLQQLGELDHQLGELYAQAINQFLCKVRLNSAEIMAIGCHGQTVWHSPKLPHPFTMQIGDMNLVAAQTGITVIGDFRRKDMALGGQGAPLVPAFHQELWAIKDCVTVVLNIGGIGNISLLLPNQPVIGYDTGPGNALMDSWIERHLGEPYDANGAWAKTGTVRQDLLAQLLQEPFFQLPAPKSTGRELFNLPWLDKILQKNTALSPLPAQDVQATLLAFTVQSVVNELDKIRSALPCRLLVCGGGAKNQLLMQKLTVLLPHWQVTDTNAQGLDSDFVEAAAFAWLAYRRIHNLPSNMPSVTGAKSVVSLGVIFPAI